MTSFSLCSYFVPIYGISCSNYAKLGEFEIMSREHFLRLIQDRTIREKFSRLEHGDVFLGYKYIETIYRWWRRVGASKSSRF